MVGRGRKRLGEEGSDATAVNICGCGVNEKRNKSVPICEVGKEGRRSGEERERVHGELLHNLREATSQKRQDDEALVLQVCWSHLTVETTDIPQWLQWSTLLPAVAIFN